MTCLSCSTLKPLEIRSFWRLKCCRDESEVVSYFHSYNVYSIYFITPRVHFFYLFVFAVLVKINGVIKRTSFIQYVVMLSKRSHAVLVFSCFVAISLCSTGRSALTSRLLRSLSNTWQKILLYWLLRSCAIGAVLKNQFWVAKHKNCVDTFVFRLFISLFSTSSCLEITFSSCYKTKLALNLS